MIQYNSSCNDRRYRHLLWKIVAAYKLRDQIGLTKINTRQVNFLGERLLEDVKGHLDKLIFIILYVVLNCMWQELDI